jgi:hypothetical protein
MEKIWADGTTGAPDPLASSGHLADAGPDPSAREEEEEEDHATGVDETCLDRDDSMDMSGDEDNDKDSSVDLKDPTARINPQHDLMRGGGEGPFVGLASTCAKNINTASHSGSTGGGVGVRVRLLLLWVTKGKKWAKKAKVRASNHIITRSKQPGKGKKGKSSWDQ